MKVIIVKKATFPFQIFELNIAGRIIFCNSIKKHQRSIKNVWNKLQKQGTSFSLLNADLPFANSQKS